uniref:UspA domain protein n=1 Tax=uncultured Chloroflexota bacterium TaxID=166587 RepID=H5SES2_9CHLR|nr:UspA domain protein [uncultured Chloroflexota bacterium]BAL56887.1 UspA domain protein [uncultured Chloroflexota bacterium]
MLKLSVYTNGHSATWPALQYGAHLAEALGQPLQLIAIDESDQPLLPEAAHPLEAFLEQARKLFQEHHVMYELEIHRGHAEDIIPARVNASAEGLHLVAPLGRPPLRRLFWGRSFRHIMARAVAPLLYVPRFLWPPQEVLICVGGIGYEVTAERIGLQLARHFQAHVTLFTVIPHADLDYPLVHQVQEHEQDLWETDTPIGRALRRGLEQAHSLGLEVAVKVRHGEVVEEILKEIRQHKPQLICMGSPFSSQSLRHYYMPNVTAEVAESGLAPVLTARFFTDHRP